MSKRKLTAEDLEINPQLAEDGLKEGDEIEIPEETNDNEEVPADEDQPADTGGSAPPPNKERP